MLTAKRTHLVLSPLLAWCGHGFEVRKIMTRHLILAASIVLFANSASAFFSQGDVQLQSGTADVLASQASVLIGEQAALLSELAAAPSVLPSHHSTSQRLEADRQRLEAAAAEVPPSALLDARLQQAASYSAQILSRLGHWDETS